MGDTLIQGVAHFYPLLLLQVRSLRTTSPHHGAEHARSQLLSLHSGQRTDTLFQLTMRWGWMHTPKPVAQILLATRINYQRIDEGCALLAVDNTGGGCTGPCTGQ